MSSTCPPKSGQLRYVLLNAAAQFGDVLTKAHSVLLVSGTLAPVSSLRAQLFPSVSPERVRHFECCHVIPSRQLLALAVGRAPGGQLLDLRSETSVSVAAMDGVGRLLLNLATVVPGGLVAFVPSFAYLDQLLARWGETGLLQSLHGRKPLFRWVLSCCPVQHSAGVTF